MPTTPLTCRAVSCSWTPGAPRRLMAEAAEAAALRPDGATVRRLAIAGSAR